MWYDMLKKNQKKKKKKKKKKKSMLIERLISESEYICMIKSNIK